MVTIRRSVDIAAAPADVFALMSRVEDYVDYCRAIHAVEPMGPKRYRWHLRLLGLPLQWEGEIVECRSPERLAWRSVGGVSNAGEFRLQPTAQGTRVELEMNFEPPLRWMAPFLRGLLSQAVDHTASEIIAAVKRRLE